MKNSLKRIAPVALVLMALAMLSFMAKETVTLRLKPQQGKTQTVITEANMTTMMEVQGQTMNMSQNMETKQTFTAKEVSANKSVIETQVEAIKMTISQMGMKLEYDSEHPEKTSPMLAGQTKDIEAELHKPTSITYDALGKRIEDRDDSLNPLGVVIELPEKEISVGSTWGSTISQESNGVEFSAENTYTVTAISKKSVDVNIAGTIKGKTQDISGSYTGTASLNPQTGILMNSNIKQNFSMVISEEGFTIPATMTGTTTVTVK